MQLRASNVGTVVSGGNTLGWFERINPFLVIALDDSPCKKRNAYNREIQAVRDIARNRMDGLQLIRANLRRAWQRILSISNIAAAQISEYDSDIQFGVGVAAIAYFEPRLLASLLAREWAPFLQAPLAQQQQGLPPPLNADSYYTQPGSYNPVAPQLQLQNIPPSGTGKRKKNTRRSGKKLKEKVHEDIKKKEENHVYAIYSKS